MPSTLRATMNWLYGLLNLPCVRDDNQQLEEMPVAQSIATQFVSDNIIIILEESEKRRHSIHA